jgi:hypothetical protein
MQGIYYVLAFEKINDMNKRFAAIFSILIIVIFIGYIIFDTSRPGGFATEENRISDSETIPDKWKISGELAVKEGSLKAVTVALSGNLFLGGDSFVSCYSRDLNLLWTIKTSYPITSLSTYGDTLFASTPELILVILKEGRLEDEWGPFEDNSIITSLASDKTFVVFADAGNKNVTVLDKNGRVKTVIGQNDGQFVIPSPYFDVALDSDNNLFIANTGQRRVEIRSVQGRLKSYFGEPGTSPGAFCGCCNPAHFIVTTDGIITAEKGINRIKILNRSGDFVEFVSSNNKFIPSVPLDLASPDGKTIYAANPADSKLYVFTRI